LFHDGLPITPATFDAQIRREIAHHHAGKHLARCAAFDQDAIDIGGVAANSENSKANSRNQWIRYA
jgi:hypothetical protein